MMKKILYIPHYISKTGGGQRTSVLLMALSERYQVDVLLFQKQDSILDLLSLYNQNCNFIEIENIDFINSGIEKREGNQQNIHLKRNWLKCSYYFPSHEYLKNTCQELIGRNDYDYIVVRYVGNVFLFGLENEKNLIVDIDDNPAEVIKTQINRLHLTVLRKMIAWLMPKICDYYVRKMIAKVQITFLPNQQQTELYCSHYLPNIPYPFFANNKIKEVSFDERKNLIVFVGAMNWFPNYDGVDWFIENVWDKLKVHIPDLQFNIIGQNIPAYLFKKIQQYDGIHYLGFVDDLYAEYSVCKAIVVPIFAGAGTNIKVLEGMQTGRPLVVSTHATRGFSKDLIDGNNIFIAENACDFVEKTIQLLRNKSLNKTISDHAVKTIKDKYSFDYFKKCLFSALN